MGGGSARHAQLAALLWMDRRVNRRNLRDAVLVVFGVISVVNGAFGNGHLLIAVLGAIALAFVAWQRWPRRAAA
jgi:hypothetical protein